MAKSFECGWVDEGREEFDVVELPNGKGKVLTLKNPIPEKVKPNFANVKVYSNRRNV
jgi:hypothetical protein